jgi:hypothetical protein
MRANLLITLIFAGGIALAGSAAPAASGGGGAGGSGGHASGGGGAAHAGATHAGDTHAGVTHGGAASGAAELSKRGFIDSHSEKIDGHHATVVVFHHAPLTESERERLHHYHFKGFDECASRGACPGQSAGEETFCRRARTAAFTRDLECLSFRTD